MSRRPSRFTIVRKRRAWPWYAGVVIPGLLLGGWYALSTTQQRVAPDHSVAAPSREVHSAAVTPVLNYSVPARLQIPKLKIDALVTSTGLTKQGDMAVPTDIASVGWYRYGAHPGNKGSAVIAGHYIGRKGEPGVFKNLEKLEAGDEFTIIDDKNQTAMYKVRETRTFGQDERPAGIFDANDKPYVNLITCGGAWDAAQHRYADRLVVFAEKVE